MKCMNDKVKIKFITAVLLKTTLVLLVGTLLLYSVKDPRISL